MWVQSCQPRLRVYAGPQLSFVTCSGDDAHYFGAASIEKTGPVMRLLPLTKQSPYHFAEKRSGPAVRGCSLRRFDVAIAAYPHPSTRAEPATGKRGTRV